MNRDIGLDFLKVLACFAVVILHVSGIIATHNSSYTITNSIYYMAEFAVPVFFMVNGYLLLNKKHVTYNYVFNKIINFLVVIFSWNILMSLGFLVIKKKIYNPFIMSINNLIQRDYFFQFWFFGSLIIIYITLPIIHKYFKKIYFARNITIVVVISSVCIDLLSLIRSVHGNSIIQIHVIQTFRLWTWFSYYLLGGLLGKNEVRQYISKCISFKFNTVIFIVMLLVLNIYQYGVGHFLYKNPYAEYFYDNIFLIIFNVNLFVLVRNHNFLDYKNRTIEIISKNIMGIYIIHTSIIKIFTHLYKFNNVITNTCLIFMVFISSLLISVIISKIPLANKLIKL